ncbi:MAG TPA: protein kinase, partial [Longimicrobium sp.]|nr:protein kinase [Longimicrobium sp.]
MAKKLKVGDRIQKYRITKVFGPGAMAISYAAATDAGIPVFFKQYKSPAVTLDWYREYVRYQKELNRRVAESGARNYCVRALDAFEAVWGGRNYFAVYELIQNGEDLGGIFEREAAAAGTHAAPVPFPARLWEQHLIWSKVFMSGINALHAAKIAHTDLKPDNAFLIEDPSIGAGYQLKLIDLDFSVLTDVPAPWHGKQGYIGTDNYRSPEHFTPGATPGAASDVFTCGLILYQLLAGHHPYWSEDQGDYVKKALSYSAPRPVLGGTMPAPANNAAVAEILYRCLAPKPGDRPTAAEVRDVLTGRAGAIPTVTTTAASRKPMTTTPDDAGSTPAPGATPAGTPTPPADGTLSPVAPIDPTAAPDVAASNEAALADAAPPIEAPPTDSAPPVDAGLGEAAPVDAAPPAPTDGAPPVDAAPVETAPVDVAPPVDAAPADTSAPHTDDTLPFPDAPPAWT